MKNALVALLLFAPALPAAPAPFPDTRPKRAPCAAMLHGTWHLSWGGCRYRAVLSADGQYRAYTPGDPAHGVPAVWVGCWRWHAGVLYVRESYGFAGQSTWTDYEVRFCPLRREGTVLAVSTNEAEPSYCPGSVTIRLEPWRGGPNP